MTKETSLTLVHGLGISRFSHGASMPWLKPGDCHTEKPSNDSPAISTGCRNLPAAEYQGPACCADLTAFTDVCQQLLSLKAKTKSKPKPMKHGLKLRLLVRPLAELPCCIA